MKRMISLLLIAALLLGLAPAALAETVIDTDEDRGIVLREVGRNTVPEGISPTTGLPFSDMEQPEGFTGQAITGRYMPMLVQIDNNEGGTNRMSPWGVNYADIIYETPLHRYGSTRMTFLFSNLIPDSVGPVRSARIGHVWMQREWNCGFLFYGFQEHEKANVSTEFSKYHLNSSGLLFSGTVSEHKPWKKYYTRRKGRPSPHNVNANVAAMSQLIPEDAVALNNAFLFTDEPAVGDEATEVTIVQGSLAMLSSSRLIYNEQTDRYDRYLLDEDGGVIPYHDFDTGEQVGFNNVIIQFTDVRWYANDVPVTTHIGEGNADFFMNGVHVAGYWKRPSMEDRTVFYGPDGAEMPMQRGRTLIVIIDKEKEVFYQ